MNLLFIVIGAAALIAGLVMLARALRGQPGTSARSTGLLIAGMMTTAFGLVLGGFAIAYGLTEPLNLNSTGAAG